MEVFIWFLIIFGIFCPILFCTIYYCYYFTMKYDRKIRNAGRTPPQDLEESRSRNLPLPGLNIVQPVTIIENLNENEPPENENDLPPAYDELFQTS